MRLQLNPQFIEAYPNDKILFTGKWTPPFAGWYSITDNGDIAAGDFSLNVDGAGSQTSGKSAHRLFTGIGYVEWTMDDFFRPTSTGLFTFTGSVFDVSNFEYRYKVQVESGEIEIRDEANNLLHTHSGAPVSGNVYKLELSGAGFRFFLNGGLVHSRVSLGTSIVYPFTYEAFLLEPSVSSPTRALPPKLTGDWRLGPVVTWTAPSHGSISTTGLSLSTEYSGGTVPGDYTLTGQIEAAADAGNVQRATATIRIPPLVALGNLSEITLDPGEVRRFKVNYDDAQQALVAWSQVVGSGSFTQGEYTAGTVPGPSIVRATAAVNGGVANITVNIPAIITNVNNYTAAKASEVIDFDTNIPVMPTFVSAGTMAEGTGAIVPGLPAGLAKDDILLLFVETANQTVSTPSGWATVADSPQGTGTAGDVAASAITVFWKRVSAVPANETAPTVADPGDHAIGQILAFRNCIATGNPWDVTSGNNGASSTSVSIPGDTTTVANCLVVLVVSNGTDSATAQTSGYTNTDLASLVELTDVNTTQGNGGGFGVAAGSKVAAGAYGATTATLANASVQGRMSIALKPGVITWSASIGSINSTSGSWTAPSLTGQKALITAANGTLTTTKEIEVLDVFPIGDPTAPITVDHNKTVLISYAEDRTQTSRVKDKDGLGFQTREVLYNNKQPSELELAIAFWELKHPGTKFIIEDRIRTKRLVCRFDSNLRWEANSVCEINISFRIREA